MTTKEALDVWLRFDSEEDEEPAYEANTYATPSGFVVEWYHTDVGQVSRVEFDTLEQAHEWYETQGYLDFTS